MWLGTFACLAGGLLVTLAWTLYVPWDPWVDQTVQPTRASLWLRPRPPAPRPSLTPELASGLKSRR